MKLDNYECDGQIELTDYLNLKSKTQKLWTSHRLSTIKGRHNTHR